MARFPTPKILKLSHIRALARYSFEVFVVGAIYFALAKLDLALTAIHPGAIPISPAPGFALAAILLRGLRIWPAIFAAALAPHAPTTIADATSADSILALSMAAAATLEAVIAGYLINVWSDGRRTFETPAGPQNSRRSALRVRCSAQPLVVPHLSWGPRHGPSLSLLGLLGGFAMRAVCLWLHRP